MMKPRVVLDVGWGALRSIFARAVRSPQGDEGLLRALAPEGLVPLDAPGRAIAPEAGWCLGCGSCEQPRVSPRRLLEALRGLDGVELAAGHILALTSMDPVEKEALEASCPAGIRFGPVADALGRLLDTGRNLGY